MIKNNPLFPEILTERTTAELFAFYFGMNIRYDHKRSIWLIWEKHYWKPDKKEQVIQFIGTLSDLLIEQGKTEKSKYIEQWGIKLQANAKIHNILTLARSTKPIALTGDEFDTKPFLFGCANGIIDLTTGKLRDGKIGDYISMTNEYSFIPDAECPKWEAFIDLICERDTELIDYLRRALGYTMTASMREQVIFLCYGQGGNGKTILFNVVSKILGEYAQTCSASMFKKNTYGISSTNDIADIDRKRLVLNAEGIKDMLLDEERLKSLSGGDRITARRLYSNNFSFSPVCKIWLYTNNYPKFDDDSYGLWRRLRVIPFLHTFTGRDRILDYDRILLAEEANGIFKWFVDSCLMWQERGLQDIPEKINQATQEYKEENNPLTEYLEERTIREAGEKTAASLLYADYNMWIASRRKTPLTQTAFGRKMLDLSYKKVREEAGYFYQGLRMHL